MIASMNAVVSLVECPRDAFQGLPRFIPTEVKVRHLRNVVAAGIGEIDFGSFVSPKAVPQMADTEEVLRRLADAVPALPRLIAIIANERGLDRAIESVGKLPASASPGAAKFAAGYPLSVADGFQRRNTGKSIADSWPIVESLQRRCDAAGIGLIVYLSMAFGNPDNEAWSAARVADMAGRLAGMGVRTISLADTIGAATRAQVTETFSTSFAALRAAPAAVILGAHFHAAPGRGMENVQAAYDAGCRRFDTSLGGYGGCPFAKDDLVGNIPTEQVVEFFERLGAAGSLTRAALDGPLASARAVFDEYGRA